RVFWADWLQLVCPFLFLHPKTKKGTNNQSRERVVISTKYFRTTFFVENPTDSIELTRDSM
ncbi:hypothetical protein, partial [Weissella confusa]|uniref:hypothetical protein n=1 Tax=Weissella confusa TaxID=1583 RepID=UPI001AEC0169